MPATSQLSLCFAALRALYLGGRFELWGRELPAAAPAVHTPVGGLPAGLACAALAASCVHALRAACASTHPLHRPSAFLFCRRRQLADQPACGDLSGAAAGARHRLAGAVQVSQRAAIAAVACCGSCLGGSDSRQSTLLCLPSIQPGSWCARPRHRACLRPAWMPRATLFCSCCPQLARHAAARAALLQAVNS